MSKRRDSKNEILDAAESVVRKLGAIHLTLEAVAVKAGVSKGGLLYNFPSKETLLQAMVSRQLDRFEHERAEVRSGLEQNANTGLRAHVEAAVGDHADSQQVCAALVAAAANNPVLLEPVRPFVKRTLEQVAGAEIGFERAAILWLATEGLWFLEMLQVSPLSRAQRKRIAAMLRRLSEAWS